MSAAEVTVVPGYFCLIVSSSNGPVGRRATSRPIKLRLLLTYHVTSRVFSQTIRVSGFGTGSTPEREQLHDRMYPVFSRKRGSTSTGSRSRSGIMVASMLKPRGAL
jgi:hypothetical protein